MFVLILAMGLANWQCSDFLEEYSQDLVYASSTTDLDEVLIGNGYMTCQMRANSSGNFIYYPFLYVMDDDANLLLSQDETSTAQAVAYYYYTWNQDPLSAVQAAKSYVTDQETDESLEKLYSHIAYVNAIVNYVDEFPNDPIEDRMRIRGECQFLRAQYYLILSNLYGWAYDVENEGMDLSVPLKKTEYVTDEYFSRATVGEVYNYILEDLLAANDNLRGVEQKSIYRANQSAVQVLLSRVCLYMEDYDNVIAWCDSVLAKEKYRLADLRTFNVTAENGTDERSYLYEEEDIIFTMGNDPVVYELFRIEDYNYARNPFAGYSVSDDLLDEFRNDNEVQDLRRNAYFMQNYNVRSRYGVCKNHNTFVENGNVYYRYDMEVYTSVLIRTAEIYLNKAEAQAMKGDLAGAVATMQPLLDTRYAEGKEPVISSLGEKELVEFIRSERRKELCFEGQRWPDLKRYAVNSKYPYNEPIRHNDYNATGVTSEPELVGYYELGRYGEDDGWILAFPGSEITYNDGNLTNPVRPERDIKGW